jgi:hypothetical protein
MTEADAGTEGEEEKGVAGPRRLFKSPEGYEGAGGSRDWECREAEIYEKLMKVGEGTFGYVDW